MIHIYTPADGPRRIEFERETRRRLESGDEFTLKDSGRIVHRDLAVGAFPPVAVSSLDDVVALLEQLAGGYAVEDEARATAARVKREQEEADVARRTTPKGDPVK